MNPLNSCFLCLRAKEYKERMVCSTCYSSFENYKFYSCPRCSKFSCSGCYALKEFESIYCLYTYNTVFSKIIVNAKDKFNINFQKLFEELFYIPIKEFLLEILLHKSYDAIILSPYRKTRIYHGYWHPNIFFEKIFAKISREIQFTKFPNIYSTHYKNKQEVYWKYTTTKSKKQTLLVCDDVLTSGKSSLRCNTALSKYFIDSQWDLFTIFRSPQK